MTWVHKSSNAQYGTITVGCNGCDAKNGDTLCTQQLPVLCIYKPTPPFQLPVGLPVPDQYNRWSALPLRARQGDCLPPVALPAIEPGLLAQFR
jgi:hypothetical protein